MKNKKQQDNNFEDLPVDVTNDGYYAGWDELIDKFSEDDEQVRKL